MDIQIGSIVCSKAGRDKGKFFAVISIDGNYTELADGDLRKTAKPKRKSIRHLAVTNKVLSDVQCLGDKALYEEICNAVNRHKED